LSTKLGGPKTNNLRRFPRIKIIRKVEAIRRKIFCAQVSALHPVALLAPEGVDGAQGSPKNRSNWVQHWFLRVRHCLQVTNVT
jgi:hypothetical protein